MCTGTHAQQQQHHTRIHVSRLTISLYKYQRFKWQGNGRPMIKSSILMFTNGIFTHIRTNPNAIHYAAQLKSDLFERTILSNTDVCLVCMFVQKWFVANRRLDIKILKSSGHVGK